MLRLVFLVLCAILALEYIEGRVIQASELNDGPSASEIQRRLVNIHEAYGKIAQALQGIPDPAAAPKPSEKFIPYKIQLLYESKMSIENKDILTRAVEEVNIKLSSFLKAPPVAEVRRARTWNETRKACDPVTCEAIPIGSEFVLPCYDKEKKVVAEQGITEKPNQLVIDLNKRGDITLALYVAVHQDPNPIELCKSNINAAYIAAASHCQSDPVSKRPTHGVMIWCRNLNEIEPDQVSYRMLHESMRPIFGESVLALDKHGCNEANFENCEGKSYKRKTTQWQFENGTQGRQEIVLSLSKHATEAARVHFDCPTLDGVEIASARSMFNPTNTRGHWSLRLFPNEIMAPRNMGHGRISNLTMSALKDSGWYEVDTSKAEPFLYGRPKNRGCDHAEKSCFELLEMARRDGDASEFKDLGPYCEDWNKTGKRIIHSLCSDDGRIRLMCARSDSWSNCPLKLPSRIPNDQYTSNVCEQSTAQPPNVAKVGGRVGKDSMCITFTSVAKFSQQIEPQLFPICVERKCDHHTKSVHVILTPRGGLKKCEYECKRDQGNTVVDYRVITTDCKEHLGESISLICPQFDAVCSKVNERNRRSNEAPSPKEEYKPYRMHLIYDQRMSDENKKILVHALEEANTKLSKAVRSPIVKDFRMARTWNTTTKRCDIVACNDIPIPLEFVLPCYDTQGKLIEENGVSEKPSELVEQLNKKGDTSIVIHVSMHNQPNAIPHCAHPIKPLASAAYCELDPKTRRPTHGMMIWCSHPKDLTKEQSVHIMLHENLHAVSASSFVSLERHGCNETHFDACYGKTWMKKNYTWLLANGTTTNREVFLSITENVKKAARDHFGCANLEGAETNTGRYLDKEMTKLDPSNTMGHWSMRLFTDEIMKPAYTPYGRLSKLTLAALLDSGWYDVDLTDAEPLDFSRPKGTVDGCAIATRSCTEIMKQVRASGRPDEVKFMGPYCEYRNETDTNQKSIIVTPRCSTNGRVILKCIPPLHDFHGFCSISLVPPFDQPDYGPDSYNSPTCQEADRQPQNVSIAGGHVGPDSMCITFTHLKNFDQPSPQLFPMCVRRECLYATKELQISLDPSQSGNLCTFKCSHDQANKIVNHPVESQVCKDSYGESISFMCPQFDAVCPKIEEKSTPAPLRQEYKPYRMHLIYDQRVSDENKKILVHALEEANAKLSKAVRSPTVRDFRMARTWNAATQRCDVVTCSNIQIPLEFVLPCYDQQGNLIKEPGVSEEPSEAVDQLHKNDNSSIVIHVFMHKQPNVVPFCDRPITTLAAAAYCELDSTTRRPTHGIMIWCVPPKDMTLGQAVHIMLHENLHAVSGGSFVSLEHHGCNETHFDACYGKSWQKKNYTWLLANGTITNREVFLSITKNVKKAAQEHFNCPNVEGAETNIAQYLDAKLTMLDSSNTMGHWSMRLFPDEIMMPTYSPYGRLSKLTLAALLDSGWYEVDLTKAESLDISRPKGTIDGCTIATKSCTEIMNQVRNTGNSNEAKFMGPYCEYRNVTDTNQNTVIITPQCSTDGRVMLTCIPPSLEFHGFCSILIVAPTHQAAVGSDSYNSPTCQEADRQPRNVSIAGGHVGPDSMCITFTHLKNFEQPSPQLFPMCVRRECLYSTKELQIVLDPSQSGNPCTFKCSHDQVNKIVSHPVESQVCKNYYGGSISFVCPDFDAVCREATNETRALSTAHGSSSGSTTTSQSIQDTKSTSNGTVPLGRGPSTGPNNGANTMVKYGFMKMIEALILSILLLA